MLLKLEGRVPSDYEVQQDTHKDKNVGLDFAKEKTIEGLTFHQHNTDKDGPFIDRIKAELAAGRFVGVYTQNPHGYHGWIVVGVDNDKLVLRSKPSELGRGEGRITISEELPIADAVPAKMTDCVFYTKQN